MNAGLFDDSDGTAVQLPDAMDAAMRFHARRVYEKCGRNFSRAVAALEISRNTLKKYLNLPTS